MARIEVIRLFLTYATYKKLKVCQMDVMSTFLNGGLEEEVYCSASRVCSLYLDYFDLRDTWYSYYYYYLFFEMTWGSSVILWFSIMNSILLCYAFYHIFMLMLFWDDSRSMRISDYLDIWCIGHIGGLCDVMDLMLWLFTWFSSLYALWKHEWCK